MPTRIVGPRVKVTLSLPRDLVKQAKHEAVDRNLNLQDIVIEGLKVVLAKRPTR
jgi:hypothetical protein